LAKSSDQRYVFINWTGSRAGSPAASGELPAYARRWIDPRDESGVLGMDLSPFREGLGREMYGIIGMDFLHQWVLQIDFDQGDVRLLKSVVPPERADSFRLYYNFEGVPVVRCGVCGCAESDFVLDTGCDGNGDLETYTSSDVVDHGYGRPISSARAQTACGEVTSNLFRVGSFALGNHLVHELTFHDGNQNRLGLGYLSRYEVTFDFPNKLLYVSEGNGFDKPDLTDTGGLHLARREDMIVVDRVDSDSAAEASGLEEDDVMLTIDGLDVDSISLENYRRVFRKDSGTVDVTYERAGRRCETTIELR
jgi:hypothetical protein